MNKKILYLFIFLALLFSAGFTYAYSVSLNNPLSVSTVPALIKLITNTVAMLVGSLSVVMIVIAGIMYLLSAGNEQKMKNAKTALWAAVIGIAIAATAGTIAAVVCEMVGATC